jgi:lysyl-tRNA synthetase class I
MTTLIKLAKAFDLRSSRGNGIATDSNSDVVTPEILRFAQDDNAYENRQSRFSDSNEQACANK